MTKNKHKHRKPLASKKAATAGYKPQELERWFLRPRDLPPFSFSTVLAMLLDPTLRLGLAMRAAPIYGAEFAYQEEGSKDWTPGVRAGNELVAAFVLRQLRKIWNNLDGLLAAQTWGWAACEIQLTQTQSGTIEIDRLLPRHSNDTRALVVDGEVRGVRFLRIKVDDANYGAESHVDLPFPKAIFHAHAPEPGAHYGTSIFNGAYSPWADKWLNGGALDVRRLFMHKDAYGGADLGYPAGTINIDGKGEVPTRDIAREIVEQMQAGAVTTRPSDVDPVTMKERWPLTRASVPSSPTHILQFPKDLDNEMLRGMEIPDEVFIPSDAGTTGYSGKSIPMQGFYSGLDRWVVRLLTDVRPVMNALVTLNFGGCGGGNWFELKTKPLGLQAMENQGEGKGQDKRGGTAVFAGGWGRDGDGDGEAVEGGPSAGQVGQRMSLDIEGAVGRGLARAADVVGFVRMKTADTPAGSRWVTIGGRKKRRPAAVAEPEEEFDSTAFSLEKPASA